MTRFRGGLTKGELIAANKTIRERAQQKVKLITVDLPQKPVPPACQRSKSKASNKRKEMIRAMSLAMGTTVHDCCYCGRGIDSKNPEEYTIEHLVPLNGGGNWTLSNMRPCCWKCNQDKGGLYLDEWLNILYRDFENTGSNCPHQLFRIMRVQRLIEYTTAMGNRLTNNTQ